MQRQQEEFDARCRSVFGPLPADVKMGDGYGFGIRYECICGIDPVVIATAQWRTKRAEQLERIARHIDAVLDESSTGTFVVIRNPRQ